MRDYLALTDGQFGLAVAAPMLGCLLATLLGGSLCDRLGSRRVMAGSALLLTLGALGACTATTAAALVSGRVVAGAGVGLASLACPMYIAEVASPAYRGRLMFLFQVGIGGGAMLGLGAQPQAAAGQ